MIEQWPTLRNAAQGRPLHSGLQTGLRHNQRDCQLFRVQYSVMSRWYFFKPKCRTRKCEVRTDHLQTFSGVEHTNAFTRLMRFAFQSWMSSTSLPIQYNTQCQMHVLLRECLKVFPYSQSRIVIFTCFGRAVVTEFLPRSLGFNPTPVHVEFMADYLELGQDFLWLLLFSLSVSLHKYRYIFMRHRRYVL